MTWSVLTPRLGGVVVAAVVGAAVRRVGARCHDDGVEVGIGFVVLTVESCSPIESWSLGYMLRDAAARRVLGRCRLAAAAFVRGAQTLEAQLAPSRLQRRGLGIVRHASRVAVGLGIALVRETPQSTDSSEARGSSAARRHC